MRPIAIACLFLSSLVTSCAGSNAGSQAPPVSAVTPGQEADRVLAIAQDLEKQGDTKKAFAAYHQIIRNFPDTPSGRKAVERIRQAQRDATRKPRPTRK
jgi:hypothetical protein